MSVAVLSPWLITTFVRCLSSVSDASFKETSVVKRHKISQNASYVDTIRDEAVAIHKSLEKDGLFCLLVYILPILNLCFFLWFRCYHMNKNMSSENFCFAFKWGRRVYFFANGLNVVRSNVRILFSTGSLADDFCPISWHFGYQKKSSSWKMIQREI